VYQPQSERTKTTGNISNRGVNALNARATPLGRYQKQIADAVGSRWYLYTNPRMDLISIGSARIRFYVNQRGQIEDLKLVHNDSNEVFANLSIQAITEAKIPPIPQEVAPLL